MSSSTRTPARHHRFTVALAGSLHLFVSSAARFHTEIFISIILTHPIVYNEMRLCDEELGVAFIIFNEA